MTSYNIAPVAPPTDPNVLIGRGSAAASVTAEPLTVTTNGQSNMLAAAIMRPTVLRYWAVPTGISGKTVSFAESDLSMSDKFGSGHLTGGSAQVWRIVNDELTEIGIRAITASRHNAPATLFETGGLVALVNAGQLSAEWGWPDYTRPGAPISFRVAAVNAAGARGAWSNIVTHSNVPGAVAASTPTSASTVTTKAMATGFAVDGSIGVPTLTLGAGADGKAAKLTWTEVSGCRYLVQRSYAADFNTDCSVTLDDASDIASTDLIVFRKGLTDCAGYAGIVSPRIYKAGEAWGTLGLKGFPLYQSELPAGVSLAFANDGTRDLLRVTVGSGTSIVAELYSHGGLDTNWYPLLVPGKTYKARLTGKASSAVTIKVEVGGVGSFDLPVATTFGANEVSFTVSADPPADNIPRSTKFILTGGNTYDIESLIVYDAEVGLGQYRLDLHQSLVQSGAGYARQHFAVKTRPASISVGQYLARLGSGNTANCGLPDELDKILKARTEYGGRINPWFQIPAPFTDAEIAAVAEYLCTPFDPATDSKAAKPWAWLRNSQGRQAPWQDAFDTLMVEPENEMWNTMSEFFNLQPISGLSPGTVNGKMLDRVMRIFATNPHFQPAKWKGYLNCWGASGWGVGSWNGDSVRASKWADYAGCSDYNGGWDVTTSWARADSPTSVFTSIADSSIGGGRKARIESAIAQLAAATAGRAKPIRFAQYESGPGYQMPAPALLSDSTTREAQQDYLTHSVGFATGTMDCFLSTLAAGAVHTNFFAFGRGATFASHSGPSRGGAMSPSFMWMRVLNGFLPGKVSRVPLNRGTALTLPSGVSGVIVGDTKEAVKVYLLERQSDGRRAFAFLNVSPDTSQTVRFIKAAGGTWTRHWMPGPHTTFNSTLATKDAVSLKSEPAPAWATAEVTLTIGPGLAEVFVEG